MKLEIKQFKDIYIYLIKIGKNIGWIANYNNKQYGAWAFYDVENMSEKDVSEAFEIHYDHAVASLENLIKKNGNN